MVRSGLTVLLLLISPLTLGASLLRDVLYTDQGAVSRLDLQLGVPVLLVGAEQTDKATGLRLKLDAQAAVSTDFSSMRVLFEEEDRSLGSVTMEGSDARGYQLQIEFTEPVSVQVLPQYGYDRLTFIFAGQPQAKKLLRFPKSAASDQYALVLKASRSGVATLEEVPERFAHSQLVYLLPDRATNASEQQLRLGFFESRAEAQRTATALRRDFPDAEIVQVSPREMEYAGLFRLNPPDLVAGYFAPAVEEVESPGEISLTIAPVTPSSLKEEPEAVVAPAPAEWTRKTEQEAGEVELVLRDARKAFAGEDYSRAVSLYSKALQQADAAERLEALEFLGVAREMNGQEAHAKRVYEQFIAEFDATDLAARAGLEQAEEAVARVQQRLAVLIALKGTPSEPVTGRAVARAERWRVNGQLGQFYRRHTLSVDENSSVPINGLFNDLNVIVGHDGDQLTQEARVTMSYLADFTGDLDGREFQVSYLAWAGYLNPLNTGLSIGRQSNSALGVLGRFDGAVLSHNINDSWGVEVAGGFVAESTFDSPDTSRPFYAVGGEYVSPSGNLVVEPFFIQQYVDDDILDRQAIGMQAQYRLDRSLVFSLLDYDLHHQVLNNATFSGDIALRNSRLFASYEYRRSPYLTTRNALIGQPYEDLTSLEQSLIDLELDQLAEDRTAQSHTLRGGFAQNFAEHWVLTADLVATDYSETETSANVIGMDSNQTVYSSVQLRSLDLFGAASYSSMMVRHADSGTSTTTSMFFDNRFALYDRFRVYPRMRVDYRTFERDDDTQWTFRPSLRLDYRGARWLRFEFEAGYEWTRREMSTRDLDIDGAFIRAGYRALF